jgi:hypothetical protein
VEGEIVLEIALGFVWYFEEVLATERTHRLL